MNVNKFGIFFMKKFLLIFLVPIIFTHLSYAQRKEMYKAYEDSIFKLHKEILLEQNIILKYQKNETLLFLMEEALEQKNSINYPFDSLRTISIITSPDKKVRIFTWYLIDDAGKHDHFGYIQAFNEQKDRYVIYALSDKWQQLVNPPNKILDYLSWYGAVYYKIIETEINNEKYYTLLGWNGGTLFSQFKVIDVLSFNNKGNPVFGAFIFRGYGKGKPARIIFEYAKKSSFTLNYDKQGYEQRSTKRSRSDYQYRIDTLYTRMIIFNHLIPMDESLKDVPQYYVGESSMNDGFLEKDGRWYFKAGVLGRNPDKPLPKYNFKLKQFYQRGN